MFRYIQSWAGRIGALVAVCLLVLSVRAFVYKQMLMSNLEYAEANRIMANSIDTSSFNIIHPLNRDKENLSKNKNVLENYLSAEKHISFKNEYDNINILKTDSTIKTQNDNKSSSFIENQNQTLQNNVNKTNLSDTSYYNSSTPEATDNEDGISMCPMYPPDLKGPILVQEEVSEVSKEARQDVLKGGSWAPTRCRARYRLAIIVPYRDRKLQILPFLQHMHQLLKRQQLNYTIYFVEQHGEELFNRACLLNLGYLEAKKEGPWDCFAFHDVDMLPEDDRNLYHCSLQPRHLAVATSAHKYRSASTLSFYKYYGGAALMTSDQIEKVNGWSNRYWGWGGEDDDMWRRIALENMAVWRLPPQIARYKMLGHKPQPRNEKSRDLVTKFTGDHPKDGLNSLKYKLLNVTKYDLYTSLIVDISLNKDVT
ncbi:unnamed protein product, partial [Meganyctiphanes norvegica]